MFKEGGQRARILLGEMTKNYPFLFQFRFTRLGFYNLEMPRLQTQL